MKKRLFEVFVCMLLIATAIPVVSLAGNWTEMQRILASDAQQADWFGGTVSVSGDTALIGASGNQEAGYVFTRIGITWSQQAKLVSDTGYWFADSVSLSGDTALISSAGEDYNNVVSGVAYVFTRTGTTWTQQAKLVPSDGVDNGEFGCSVSIDGNTVLIGARADDENGLTSGSAYVFTRTGTTWTQQAKLLASDGIGGEEFGYSVSISGDTALIGTDYAESVYVFTRTGTTWIQQQKLTASDATEEDYFGYSVSLDGNTALIGAILDDDNEDESGSAYVFTRTGTTWTQQAKLHASDGVEGDRFGQDVSLDGDTALIGTNYAESAYIFTRTGTTWTQQQKLTASDATEGDSKSFGASVSLDGNTALIGAFWDTGDQSASGSAYVFTKGGGNAPPVAGFTWTPSNPEPNQTINFDASASYVPQGSIILYEWDWDSDGVYEESHTTPTATHTWASEYNYGVTLRVTDNSNATGTKSMAVWVGSEGDLIDIPDTTPTEPKTPGFELIFVIGAIAVGLLLWRKKRIV
jgi:FG-GAP repeat/PKD domain